MSDIKHHWPYYLRLLRLRSSTIAATDRYYLILAIIFTFAYIKVITYLESLPENIINNVLDPLRYWKRLAASHIV